MVEEETFRALARSSPWLWSSVRLTRTMVGRENVDRVRAWIRRPGLMRVEPDGGEPYTVDETRNAGRGRGAALYSTAPSRRRSIIARVLGRSALPAEYRELDTVPGDYRSAADASGTENVEPQFRTPQDPLGPQPPRRNDGLVTVRPRAVSIAYDDPMYENYLWVAMLDPVELADGAQPDDVFDDEA
jgi:hypothetical protein